nr:hypothetical protein [Aliiroseovarius subalbicans]
MIRESYNIDGIHIGECRSIFLDWALFDDHDTPQPDRIRALLDHYGGIHPDHPMTQVLRDALTEMNLPKGRRGGRKARTGP